MSDNSIDDIFAKLGLTQKQLQGMTGKDFFGPDFVMDLDRFVNEQKQMPGFGFQCSTRISAEIYGFAVQKYKTNKPLTLEEFFNLAFNFCFHFTPQIFYLPFGRCKTAQ